MNTPGSEKFRRTEKRTAFSKPARVLFVLSLVAQSHAAPLYWDQNGATPGFQTGNSSGNWGTSNFWSADASGSSATGAYVSDVDTTDAVFASGMNNSNNSIALGASQAARSLTFQNGRWAFTGTATITLGTGGMTFAVPATGSAGGDTTFASTIGFSLAGSQTWTNNANNATNQIVIQGAVAGSATTGNTHTLTLAGSSSGSGMRFQGVVSDGSGGGKLGITVESLASTGAATTTYQLNNLAHTFTGKVAVKSGGLAVNYLANAGVASSLGAAAGADSIIDLGSGANTGGLTLGGTGNGTITASTSNRVINLAGTTGGGLIRNQASDSAVTLTLTGGVTNAGGGAKTLALGGSNIGVNTISGVIADAEDSSKTSLLKQDAGLWVLSGANTYSGGTTINAGTLAVAETGTLGANVSGNNISIAGGNLLLSASGNVGANQTITITSAGGGIGVSYDPVDFPSITDNSGATGGVFGINYTGTGGIGSIAGINALFTSSSRWFLGSFVGGAGTYTGTSLTAGFGNTYRLGGGGGSLTIQNDILTGANNLLVGSTGGGTVTLSNANTFTGTTTLQNGTLNVSSLNRVSGGTASSSLGAAPIDATTGTITIGSGTNVVSFNYTGAGETTDRVLRFAGTTGNVTLGNSGTGAVNYAGSPVFSGNGNKTLFLGNATDTVGGSIGAITNSTGTTSLTKQGQTNSRWVLSGGAGNTYTGNTAINGGVLETGAVADLATSYVALSGVNTSQYAVWQTNGTISRVLSTTASAANLNWGVNAGFAAKGGSLELNFSAGAPLVWGNAAGFMGAGVAPMVFGSSTADSEVELKNSFTLGNDVSNGFSRVIHVEKGTGGDSAKLSGVISQGVDTNSSGDTLNTGINKQGAGTLIFSGNNSYTGTTAINAGKLLINGDQTAATGAVSTAIGATLGGAGIVGGATTIVSGSFLTPGATETGAGVLTFKNGLVMNGTATLQVFSAGARGVAYDAIDIAGGAFTGTGALVLNFSSLLGDAVSLDLFGGAALTSFSSVTATGLYTGVFSPGGGFYTLVSGGQTLTLDVTTGDLLVTGGAAVPEPATFAVLAGGLVLAGAMFTRRRRRGEAPSAG